MLQQTQVATVIDYYARWLRRFPDFPTLARAAEADVLQMWQGLGYYSRARNLHRAARVVMEKHVGKFPTDLVAIRELPGIGPYTAGAVATFAFDQSTPIIDANIARVIARLFEWKESIDLSRGRQFLWQTAGQLQPSTNAGLFNSALMELGALVCVPRKPVCSKCPVEPFCMAKNPGRLPVKQARRKTVRLREQCAYIYKGGKVLLQQERARRWRGLWKLPLHPGAKGKPLVELEYPFTHHRITLAVFAQQAPKRIGEHQRWFDSIEEVAMPPPTSSRRAAIVRRNASEPMRGTQKPAVTLPQVSSFSCANRSGWRDAPSCPISEDATARVPPSSASPSRRSVPSSRPSPPPSPHTRGRFALAPRDIRAAPPRLPPRQLVAARRETACDSSR